MVRELTLGLGGLPHSYPLRIGAGVLDTLGDFARTQVPTARQWMVVTDSFVAPHYEARVRQALEAAGYTVTTLVLLPGESHKTWESLEEMYDHALQAGLKRNDGVIALGGGIVGDVTGFFASSYLRGVPFIQVPTTLLAQVDASVGGKVAINWKHLKNMVGAFYQPHGVLIDTDTLKTLPQRELICGLAEVVKYALLEQGVPNLPSEPQLMSRLSDLSLETVHTQMDDIIYRCCALKAAVVEADPEERHGIREILNLGHTFAHAYETLSQGQIQHGEAVGMGLVNAVALSVRLGQLPEGAIAQLNKLLQAFHLAQKPPVSFDPDQVMGMMGHDKKNVSGEGLRLILPVETLGRVRVQSGVDLDVVKAVLAQ